MNNFWKSIRELCEIIKVYGISTVLVALFIFNTIQSNEDRRKSQDLINHINDSHLRYVKELQETYNKSRKEDRLMYISLSKEHVELGNVQTKVILSLEKEIHELKVELKEVKFEIRFKLDKKKN